MKAVNYTNDDCHAANVLAHVADMVENLGCDVKFEDVWGALEQIHLDDSVLPPDATDRAELISVGCGLWSERER